MIRRMKESGIEWIGDIPEEWGMNKVGAIYSERNEKVSDKDYDALSVTKQGIVPQLESAAKTNDGDNRKLVRINDFVINSRSDRRGSCGISLFSGSVSLINTVLRPRKNMNNMFYQFVFKSDSFANEFFKWGNGIVNDLWSTKWSSMKKIYIPAPTLIDQLRIAIYLDRHCTLIDQTVNKEKQVIEKLKEYKQSVITEAVTKGLNPNVPMQDSGIEWIGEIPEHWEVIKIKRLGLAQNGLTYRPEDIVDEGEGILVLRSSNVQNGKLALNDNVYVCSGIVDRLKILKGDILICSRNGSKALIGKNTLIDIDIEATFGAFMMIFRSENNRYIHKLLNSEIFNYYLGTFLTSTINQLTLGNFNNMEVVYCKDTNEQNSIVDFLDKKCSAIDHIIDKKQQSIQKIEEYKKSLIYECVTGKREVK